MSKEEIEIIVADVCTSVDESFVKQARELLDREGRSEIAKMFKILLDHNEKTSGKDSTSTGSLGYSKLPNNRKIEEPVITWSDFLSLFSDDPTGSSVSEMFEFLKSQDRGTLPQELQEVLKWHENKLGSDDSTRPVVQQSKLWYLKTFVLFLLMIVKMCGLYYADILADILQTVSLYNNCHRYLCTVSVGIILTSFFTTAVYTKFTENLQWSKAILYPWLFEGKARKHIVKSWNALVKGDKLPALPPKDERFNREVAFIEATTESISQFTLGNVIVRVFGISDDPTSKALQYFSLTTSSLSLSMAFVTRQTFHRPMKTVNVKKNLRGLSVWLLWNLGYLLYLLCTGLPILLYIVCLFLMAVKREASITLSIIMAAMINPLVAIPIGVAIKTTGQFFKRKFLPISPTSTLTTAVLRLFTYSLNCHLTFIAGFTYYLYIVWIDSEESSSINFNNLPYNLCFCEFLTEIGFGQDYCANWESETSFQNQLIIVSLPLVLQMFLLTSFLCHLIHSLIIFIPSPFALIDFYVGLKQDNSKSFARIPRPTCSRTNLRYSLTKLRGRTNIFKASCCLVAIIYLVCLVSSPYYGFNLFLGSSADENDTVCKTKDNHACIFPFEYEGHNFSTCSDLPRKDLPSNSLWCAIDNNYKSVGVCKDSCPTICRLSSGSVCNVLGTYNCSTSQCYCKLDYEGELCERCNWREFSFVSSQRIDGTIDPINGYGVTCKEVGPIGLWIAGGERYEEIATVEFITDNNSNNQVVPNLPKSIDGSPSMFLHNETIMLCGGKNNQQTCLKLEEDTWTDYNSFKEERFYASVVSTTTATFIFGGLGSEHNYEYLEKNASEWKLGQTKIPGNGFYDGCSIAIFQDEIWLIGGGRFTKQRILSFSVNNQNFTVLPTKLKKGRYRHQCAFIPGTRHLMITGGYTNEYSDSTEIIDVENRNVTEGPPMNSKRGEHGIGVLNIDGQERVVVFGGYNSEDVYLKSVEVYNAQTQRWERTNIELSEAKAEFGFMTIKSRP